VIDMGLMTDVKLLTIIVSLFLISDVILTKKVYIKSILYHVLSDFVLTVI
jgi:hypothetical protein